MAHADERALTSLKRSALITRAFGRRRCSRAFHLYAGAIARLERQRASLERAPSRSPRRPPAPRK